MKFTYQAYRELLGLLRQEGYAFRGYHETKDFPRSVILRHDVDESLEMALKLAELEAQEGVSSTYFVLLRTDFYNVASRHSQEALHRLQALGHEIGLHFDEVGYGRELTETEVVEKVLWESRILSDLLEVPVKSVSMHRPSRRTLDADLKIPGMVNSYGKTYFQDFKYLSDSRRHWREPVLEIIRSGDYDHLHILTHAFWYHEEEQSIEETVGGYIRAANAERYRRMEENIRDLAEIIKEDAI